MAVIGKLAKKRRTHHGWVCTTRRDTVPTLDGHVLLSHHIELDDELREYYRAKCDEHVIRKEPAVDLDLCRVLCVMWIRSLAIQVRLLFS